MWPAKTYPTSLSASVLVGLPRLNPGTNRLYRAVLTPMGVDLVKVQELREQLRSVTGVAGAQNGASVLAGVPGPGE